MAGHLLHEEVHGCLGTEEGNQQTFKAQADFSSKL